MSRKLDENPETAKRHSKVIATTAIPKIELLNMTIRER